MLYVTLKKSVASVILFSERLLILENTENTVLNVTDEMLMYKKSKYAVCNAKKSIYWNIMYREAAFL